MVVPAHNETGALAHLPAAVDHSGAVPAGPGPDRRRARRVRRRQRRLGRPVRSGCAFRDRSTPAMSAPPARRVRLRAFVVRRSVEDADLVRHHRCRQCGRPRLAAAHDRADADMVLGVVRITGLAAFLRRGGRRYLRATDRKAAATTTFTARTWAFAPTPTGGSADSAPWPQAKTSSWCSVSNPRACTSTATPRCRWPPRTAARAGHLAGSPHTCGTCRLGPQREPTAGMSDRTAEGMARRGGVGPAAAGTGETAKRCRRLAELAEIDVVAGRLAEAHADAVAILAELGGPDTQAGPVVGRLGGRVARRCVCARARRRRELDGTKPWCSGAGLCTHALVTARLDGERGLFAVDCATQACSRCRAPGATPDGRLRHPHGAIQRRRGDPVGTRRLPGRPGFLAWRDRGRRVLAGRRARRRGAAVRTRRRRSPIAHTLAHLGAVDAAMAAAEATLMRAARHVDAGPDATGAAELVARRTRAVVETAVDEAISRTGTRARAGPAVPGRRACSAGCRSDDLCPAEPRRTGSGGVGATGGSQR